MDGPNICKSYLIGEHGCEFAEKTGRKCWYSHDLQKAALPLHDKNALRKHLISAEAFYNQTSPYEDLIAVEELQRLFMSGEVTEDEFFQKTVLIGTERLARMMQWYNGRKAAAEKTLGQIRQTGKIEAAGDQSDTPVLNIKGLSGADILRLCGAEKPFGMQSKRKALKAFGVLATEVCDESDGWETEEEWSDHADVKSRGQKGKQSRRYTRTDTFDTPMLDSPNPFAEDDMFELACQGIKPWEDDAVGALMMLNGGFWNLWPSLGSYKEEVISPIPGAVFCVLFVTTYSCVYEPSFSPPPSIFIIQYTSLEQHFLTPLRDSLVRSFDKSALQFNFSRLLHQLSSTRFTAVTCEGRRTSKNQYCDVYQSCKRNSSV